MKIVLFIFILISYICPCIANELDIGKVIKATRQTSYGENAEKEVKKEFKKYSKYVVDNIPSYILAPTVSLGSFLINKKIEIEPFNSHFLKYEYEERRVSYEIKFEFN